MYALSIPIPGFQVSIQGLSVFRSGLAEGNPALGSERGNNRWHVFRKRYDVASADQERILADAYEGLSGQNSNHCDSALKERLGNTPTGRSGHFDYLLLSPQLAHVLFNTASILSDGRLGLSADFCLFSQRLERKVRSIHRALRRVRT